MIANLMNYDHQTVFLYLGIAAAASFFAFLAENSGNNKKLYYVISFFILAFFAATTGVGTDRRAYTKNFLEISLFNIPEEQEIGFALLQIVIKIFTRDPAIFLGLIGAWTVYNFYRGFWEFKNELSLGWAVCILSAQYYFQSFNLVRIYFAVSFLVRGAVLLKGNRFGRYFALTILCATIHYSAVFAGAAFLLAMLFMRSSQRSLDGRMVIVIICAVLGSAFFIRFLVWLREFWLDAGIQKYSSYLNKISETAQSIGFKFILDIAPFVLIILLKRYVQERKYLEIAMGYLTATAIISALSYSVPVLGRGLIDTSMPVLIILPMQLKQIGMRKNSRVELSAAHRVITVNRSLFLALTAFFFGFALIMYLSEYIPTDMLNNFHFVWD